MKKIIYGFVLLIAAQLSFADKLPVVVSFSVLSDITKNIGGDKVAITTFVGPNQDAHEFEVKPSNIRTLKSSKLFVMNGFGLEGWLGRLADKGNYNGVVVVASSGIKPLTEQDTDEAKSNSVTLDPHAWNDPTLVVKNYIPNILAGLIKADPQNAAYYKANALKYSQQVVDADNYVKSKLAPFPANKRVAVTTHDAFGYFAKHYQINFISAQGVSTDSDASAKDIANLESLIRKTKIKVVFLENMTNNRLIAQIGKDTGAKIGGQLYSDALSSANQPAPTYIAMLKQNADTLVAAWK